MAEHLTVDQGVVGSTPISHPDLKSLEKGSFLLHYSQVWIWEKRVVNLSCIIYDKNMIVDFST